MLIEDNTSKYCLFHTFNNIVVNLTRYIKCLPPLEAIYTASKTKEHVLKNSTIGNRLSLLKQTLELLVPKIRTGGSFYLRAIRFQNSKKKLHSWISYQWWQILKIVLMKNFHEYYT